MMTEVNVEVLIVGAGPTGLTLACELARYGVSFRILEASSAPQKGSRGKGIQPRTLEVFDNLGIVDRVLAHGRMAMPMVSTGADGQVSRRGGEIPVPRPDVPYGASLITPEWRIEEALRDRLAELGGKVEFGAKFLGFEQSEEAVLVTVETDDGSTAVSARWLIGCDGGHSAVRKAAGIEFVGETFESIRMIVADVGAEGFDRESWHTWSHPEGLAALCPLPSTDEFQLQIGIGPGQNADLTLENMQATLERRSGRTDIHLREPSWSSLWRANVRMVDRYRSGSVLLAGDAAHIHSPAGGQGMNTGIQDAHNLGWKLAAVLGGAASTLIDTYVKERLPVAAGVIGLSNELLQRAIASRSIEAVRGDTRTLQLGVGYRDSALSQDDRTEATDLRAGDRAPDAPGLIVEGEELRLFDLLRGEHFTLLSFGPLPDLTGVREKLPWLRLRAYRVGTDLVDGGGHLGAAYRLSEGSLVLIRPDGYVGLISDRPGGEVVGGYLAAFFHSGSSAGQHFF